MKGCIRPAIWFYTCAYVISYPRLHSDSDNARDYRPETNCILRYLPSRAVQNWERLSIRLLQKEYAEVQAEIQERQRLYLQHRQTYIQEVMADHEQEMSRFPLHKKSSVEEVDKQFLRCFSAKTRGSIPVKTAYRPRSAYRSQPRSAADMAEQADVNMADIIGHHPSAISMQNRNQSNATISSLYRMPGEERRAYRPQQHFDDPNRYRQNNLFDPDVIFSPEMMAPPRDPKDRPVSATSAHSVKTNLRARPKSAVFLTEQKPDRPLKYETTRPVSGKPSRQTVSASHLGRRNSSPTKKTTPSSINKKEIHSRSGTRFNNHGEEELDTGFQPSPGYDNGDFHGDRNQNQMDDNWEPVSEDHGENGDQEGSTEEKAPMKVKVKKNDPIDKFVEDLKLMSDMENDFKRSAVQLQKKLGLESSGFVF